MKRILRWTGIGFVLGMLAGSIYVFAIRDGAFFSPSGRAPARGEPAPTAVAEGAVREFIGSLLPDGMVLARIEPAWFREQPDGSFSAGYRLRFVSSVSWFRLPVGPFQPPKGADALQRKLASYLIFYPDLEPGSCYRVNRRMAVATKGKSMVVRWAIERAVYSGGRWSLEKAGALPFEEWGRVFAEDEVAEVEKEERSVWETMVRTLARIREGGSFLPPEGGGRRLASQERAAASGPHRDLSGERVAKALPAAPVPAPGPVFSGPGGAGSPPAEGEPPSAGARSPYEEYERRLKAAAEEQRAKLAAERKNASGAGPSPSAKSGRRSAKND
ncbi:hypothetical protein [Methylacidimicrobium sp. AP8]|uniref:hypothetical protein n=1 Tax=Methylacidimicrobium sp. AP8 TaxID=2730359 RepID=UPI0019221557|nr:hypothetical protein [Methylacidimicrobium sp. AP8]